MRKDDCGYLYGTACHKHRVKLDKNSNLCDTVCMDYIKRRDPCAFDELDKRERKMGEALSGEPYSN